MTPEKTTSEIQMIAARQIASQAELCSANMERIKDKVRQMNGDVGELSKTLGDLKEQMASFTLEMTTQMLSIKAEIGSLKQRWNIWPTLEKILLLFISLAALGISVYGVLR